MARKYHKVTELGKLLDPIADKILILAALIIASVFGEIYWWITILFMIREIAITLVRIYVVNVRGRVIAASSAGKYKTLTQSIGIAMIIAPLVATLHANPLPSWMVSYYAVAFGLLGISLGFAFYSAVLYVYSAFFEGSSDSESQVDDAKNAVPLPPVK